MRSSQSGSMASARRRWVAAALAGASVGLGASCTTATSAPAGGDPAVVTSAPSTAAAPAARSGSPTSGSAETSRPETSGPASSMPTGSASPDPAAAVWTSVDSATGAVAPGAVFRVRLRGGGQTNGLTDVWLRAVSGVGAAHGHAVPGSLTADGRRWASTAGLVPDTRYVARARVGGSTYTKTFHTGSSARTLVASVSPLTGGTVGTGMPVIVSFNHDVSNRVAVQRALSVTSTPVVTGAWHWFGRDTVVYRPKAYWPAGTRVRLEARLAGVRSGDITWGARDRTVGFRVGPSVVSRVDLSADLMKVYVGGRVARTIPVTGGKSGMATRSGTSLIITKEPRKRMSSETVGYGKDSGEYYDLMVRYAMRITWSGEFLHAAPWSVGSQGRANVSHGCVGMSTTDAGWVFRHVAIGTPVEVRGTERPLEQGNGWTYWDLGWAQWLRGGAAHVGA